MATVFAGRYQEYFVDPRGRPTGGVPLAIYDRDTTTLSTLFADRTATRRASNPILTDLLGNGNFFVAPGEYDLVANGRLLQITVFDDPGELLAQVAIALVAASVDAQTRVDTHGASTTRVHGVDDTTQLVLQSVPVSFFYNNTTTGKVLFSDGVSVWTPIGAAGLPGPTRFNADFRYTVPAGVLQVEIEAVGGGSGGGGGGTSTATAAQVGGAGGGAGAQATGAGGLGGLGGSGWASIKPVG